MKCELCHEKDAETAIQIERDGVEDELYVCRACANQERVRRQKKSQRTRKMTGLPPGVSMSVTQIGGSGDEAPPPIIEAIMNAFQGFVSEMGAGEKSAPSRSRGPEAYDFPCARLPAAYRIGDALQLEGLFLIGEIEPVRRALRALGMQLVGTTADGITDAGHVYRIRYTGSSERAKRVVKDLLTQERNARVRLFEEMPRVFGDALCRALAVLKNCRLLAPGELFDLLSPLRLAAQEKMLDGITLRQLETMLEDQDLSSAEDKMEQVERDRIDAERADAMNARFEDVVLNERAEEKFL